MKIIRLLSVFILLSHCLLAQDVLLLEKNIESRSKDSTLAKDLLKLSSFYLKTDSLKTIHYAQEALTVSQDHSKNFIGKASKRLGLSLFYWGDQKRGAEYFQESMAYFRSKNDSLSEYDALVGLVSMYQRANEENQAVMLLKDYLSEHGKSSHFNFLINNRLGSITKSIGDYDLAMQFYDLSESYLSKVDTSLSEIKMAQISNDKNRGVIYRTNGNYDKAAHYLNRSLKSSIQIGSKRWVAVNYNSLALMYELTEEIDQAIDYFEKSLQLKRELNYGSGVITTLTNLGNLYRQQKNYTSSLSKLKEAKELIDENTQLYRRAHNAIIFSKLYNDMGYFEKAYENLSLYNDLKDSLQGEEKTQLVRELDAKYKNKAYQIEQEKLKAELDAADLREKNKTAQLKEQKNYIIFGGSFGVILIVLVVLVIRSNMKRKKVNNKLNYKNQEILNKNERIEEQSNQLKLKNEEILDSISYAKRIQQAILPPLKLVRSFLNDSFVLYLPKDIVAGDFYWMEPLDDKIIFAAADCTGHGVPGAMVSVICNNGLNRSVREFGLTKPSEILDKTREIVIQEFEKSEDDVNDGMDISLVSMEVSNDEKTIVEYAGANNPLWIIRKGEFEESLIGPKDKLYSDSANTYSLLEIKADKEPIGKYASKTPYSNREFSLSKGDTIYLFSDGYVDQFGKSTGHERDKKFKARNFRDLLFDIQQESLNRQKELLLESFNTWKGGLEQVDDVCIVGVKL
jgi:serine phosphatase RsbU (regulator of sigma subunit)